MKNQKNKIIINTRCLAHPLTGIQRYLSEILKRLPENIYFSIAPELSKKGGLGHFWEQCILPTKLNKSLLWSPGNTGPVSTHNQVVTVHDCSTIDHPDWFSPSFSWLYNRIIPRIVLNSRAILTVSQFTKTRLLKNFHISPSKIFVTPLASDLKYFEDKIVMDGLSKILGFDFQKTKYILTVGSIEPRKNLSRVIDSYLKVPELSNVPLVITGDIGPTTRFKNVKIPSNSRIILTGRLSDAQLSNLYTFCNFFVYLSLYEGFGLPILEAMSLGAPVLTSNRGSLFEISHGVAAHVSPDSEDDISSMLKTVFLSSSLRSRLSELGKERSNNFSWDKTAKQTLKILLEIASVKN